MKKKTLAYAIGALATVGLIYWQLNKRPDSSSELATATPSPLIGEAAEGDPATDRPGWMGRPLPAWYRPEK